MIVVDSVLHGGSFPCEWAWHDVWHDVQYRYMPHQLNLQCVLVAILASASIQE